MALGHITERLVRLPRVEGVVKALAAECEPGAAVLDIGCGSWSPLRGWLPDTRLIGVDAHEPALETAAANATHDHFVKADVLDDIDTIRSVTAHEDIQLVVMLHVVEHVPKEAGFRLIDSVETLTSRFVVLETPNRFQPQGAEYGNEAQRHLSGWFQHDFEGRGYTVRGTAGTRALRGYSGAPKLSFRGGESLDFLLARLLFIERNPRFAYSLAAYKDVRGAPARLS
jgi:hypothetical protein